MRKLQSGSSDSAYGSHFQFPQGCYRTPQTADQSHNGCQRRRSLLDEPCKRRTPTVIPLVCTIKIIKVKSSQQVYSYQDCYHEEQVYGYLSKL
ncbi:hypothetical protein L596_003808 [Steinernema carpocapsae]|uniref:Uncharacterized protein n=1 Tax=Steinernema carpocapsae TaxID=34508 RepID=A0A4U8UTM0_STECR|nr:hypothetical protein L596_003808 [Steinernema carpocapsae]